MGAFSESLTMLNQAGWVGWVLVVCAFGIWSLVYFRYQWVCNEACYLEYSDRIKEIARINSKNKALDIFYEKLNLHDNLLKSLVLVAPLLGLLGTVTGMIETFASLETMEMFRSGGGIAVGVSQALYTTQMGLIVSIPALLTQRWVNNRKGGIFTRMTEEIDHEI